MTGKVGGGISPGDITVQPAPSNTERTQQALRRSLNALRLEVPAEVAIDVSEHVRQHVAALEAELAAARAEAERMREANAAFYNDAAVMAGYVAVQRMFILRVGTQRDHAQAFRDAALAEAAPEETP